MLWIVEVREDDWAAWMTRDICETRAGARQNQIDARKHWRFTRIAKYVREAA